MKEKIRRKLFNQGFGDEERKKLTDRTTASKNLRSFLEIISQLQQIFIPFFIFQQSESCNWTDKILNLLPNTSSSSMSWNSSIVKFSSGEPTKSVKLTRKHCPFSNRSDTVYHASSSEQRNSTSPGTISCCLSLLGAEEHGGFFFVLFGIYEFRVIRLGKKRNV